MTDKEKELVEQILKKIEPMHDELKELNSESKGLLGELKVFRSEFKGLEKIYKKGFSEVNEKLDNIIQTDDKINSKGATGAVTGEETNDNQMTAEQILKAMEIMDNGERIKLLEALFHKHYDNRPNGDLILATKNYIEDYLDRNLTEEEIKLLDLAYDEGYRAGWKSMFDKRG